MLATPCAETIYTLSYDGSFLAVHQSFTPPPQKASENQGKTSTPQKETYELNIYRPKSYPVLRVYVAYDICHIRYHRGSAFYKNISGYIPWCFLVTKLESFYGSHPNFSSTKSPVLKAAPGRVSCNTATLAIPTVIVRWMVLCKQENMRR